MLVIGDSHTPPYIEGGRRLGLPIRGGMIAGGGALEKPFVTYGEPVRFIEPRLTAAFPDGLTTPFVASLGFHGAAFAGMLARHKADFGEVLEPGHHYISDQVMEAMIGDRQAEVLKFITHMAGTGLLIGLIRGASPQRRHRGYQFYGARVLELFRLQAAPVEAAAASLGVPVLEPDDADAEGFLRPEFEGPDGAHANAERGKLGAQMIADLFEQRGLAGARSGPMLKLGKLRNLAE